MADSSHKRGNYRHFTLGLNFERNHLNSWSSKVTCPTQPQTTGRVSKVRSQPSSKYTPLRIPSCPEASEIGQNPSYIIYDADPYGPPFSGVSEGGRTGCFASDSDYNPGPTGRCRPEAFGSGNFQKDRPELDDYHMHRPLPQLPIQQRRGTNGNAPSAVQSTSGLVHPGIVEHRGGFGLRRGVVK